MKTDTPACCILLTAFLLLTGTNVLAELKDIVENLDSKVQVKLSAYPQKPADTLAPNWGRETATMELAFRYEWATWFETGGGFSIDTTGWVERGMPNSYRWQGGVELFQDENPESRIAVINELYTTRPLGVVDLVVGRQILNNSVSVLYPLADRYTPYDYNDPVDTKAFGIWQARMDAYLGDWQASIALLPVFQPSKTPGYQSRWWITEIEPITGESIPAGAQGRIDRNIPGVSLENAGAFATLKTRQHQWDFFTSVYHGHALYPVIGTDAPAPTNYVVSIDYVPGFDWSAGLSTTMIDPLEIHAEALYHRTYSGRDDDYVNALLGCTWRTEWLSRWLRCNQSHLVIEYAREKIIREQDPAHGYASSSKPFRFGRNSLLAECLIDVNEKNSAAVAYSHSFERENAFLQLRGAHRFLNGIRAQLILDTFFGNGLYYGDWVRNNRLSFVLEYSF